VQFLVIAQLMPEQVTLFARQLSIQIVKYVNLHLGPCVVMHVLLKQMPLTRLIVQPKVLLVDMSEQVHV
jgi:hypothetical protein